MTKSSNDILSIDAYKNTNVKPGTPVEKKENIADNSDGGGNMKDNRYVTHEELNHAVDNLNSKIDLSTEKIMHQLDVKNEQISTKFEKQKVWSILTLISVLASAAGIIGFLINIFK